VPIYNRGTATKAPEKVEVFIDDKRVLVDPGTTVLQVGLISVTASPGMSSMPLAVIALLKISVNCETGIHEFNTSWGKGELREAQTFKTWRDIN
jgi:hypothetical protein